jgi:hypothetical protein
VLEDDQGAFEVSAWLDGYYEYFNHPNGELRAEAIKSWYRNDVVGYYGKSVSPDTIVADKFTFAERWPVRSYRIRSGSIAVKQTALRGIEDPTDAVRVTGIVDWRCESPERRQVSSGSASFEYILFPKTGQSYADRGFRISTEDMTILSRRVEAMDTAVCAYSTPPYSGPCGRKQ